jgi:hypothetical protein
MMAKAPKDEFGTPFGQAGSAAAAKLGTPFGQAGSAKAAQDANIAESDARLRARIPSSPNFVAPEVPVVTETPKSGDNTPDPNEGFTSRGNQALFKGVPFNGMRNGIQFINGYRQDMYNPDGSDRENQQEKYTKESLDRMSQEQKTEERLSAYNILKMEFEQYGLGSLVTDIRDLLINNTPVSEFGLRLRGTDAYKERFKANEARIGAGLAALSPAEYVALEDQYQNVMRNYGLPASYYTKDKTGKQVGFEKFIAGDVSAAELEDRISTAQKRVINANPEVSQALRAFYPDITNGDILAYTLDPSQGLEAIKRKVTAAEIGGAAMAQGLSTGAERAMQLAGYGVTKEQAQQGFQTVADIAPRGSQLADIYGQQPYTQETAEAEVFNTSGSAQAAARRRKLKSLEEASFGGSSGVGALGRDKAIYGGSAGQAGLY